jgi:hypothetical protein
MLLNKDKLDEHGDNPQQQNIAVASLKSPAGHNNGADDVVLVVAATTPPTGTGGAVHSSSNKMQYEYHQAKEKKHQTSSKQLKVAKPYYSKSR